MKKTISIALSFTVLLLTAIPALAVQPTLELLANATKLQPLPTGYDKLDIAVEEALAEIIKPGMSQYQKLKAAYDYCVTSFTYDGVPLSNPIGEEYYTDIPPDGFTFTSINYEKLTEGIDYPTLLTPVDCVFAETVLREKEGVCDHYTAAFVALANTIGFEAHDIAGSIQGTDGRWYGHAWALVKLGDSYYIFDPQAEQYNMRENQIRYINFGTPASSSNTT